MLDRTPDCRSTQIRYRPSTEARPGRPLAAAWCRIAANGLRPSGRRRLSVTVLASRRETPGERDGRGASYGAWDALITADGVSMAPVTDLGAGRGPFWLDEWLARGGADVVTWRRQLHANPELSRQEFATTELI